MDYPQAMEFLTNLTTFGINLGLGRIQELLARLGHPEQCGVKFIHVGGTNGKGSTGMMLSQILQAGGYRTGFFSSPHLQHYQERVRIDGCLIAEAEIAAQITKLKPILESMIAEGLEAPTEFEVSTALALNYFCEQKVDWAVIEVGLGGAIDSTNVITPEAAVITNVAMDHMDYLGNSIKAIAQVKAGIIKPGVPVITAATGEALDVIMAFAQNAGSKIYSLGQAKVSKVGNQNTAQQEFDLQIGANCYQQLSIRLLGAHQISNAALAVLTAQVLGLPAAAIRKGLAQAVWPGRLEIISQKPLIVLDGAHNCHGMQALSQALKTYWPNQPKLFVLGMLADKERAQALEIILPQMNGCIVTKPPNARAGNWQELGQMAKAHGQEVVMIEDIATACAQALEQLKPEQMLVVTGSLYMLAVARKFLLEVIN